LRRATRSIGFGLLADRRLGGRVIYGVRRNRVRFVAVASTGLARRPAVLARRLTALGLR
jgi:hypothetical protein